MIEWSHTAARVLQCGSCFIPTEQQKTGIKNPHEKDRSSCRFRVGSRSCAILYTSLFIIVAYTSRVLLHHRSRPIPDI